MREETSSAKPVGGSLDMLGCRRPGTDGFGKLGVLAKSVTGTSRTEKIRTSKEKSAA